MNFKILDHFIILRHSSWCWYKWRGQSKEIRPSRIFPPFSSPGSESSLAKTFWGKGAKTFPPSALPVETPDRWNQRLGHSYFFRFHIFFFRGEGWRVLFWFGGWLSSSIDTQFAGTVSQSNKLKKVWNNCTCLQAIKTSFLPPSYNSCFFSADRSFPFPLMIR